jgi:hypothetical protein
MMKKHGPKAMKEFTSVVFRQFGMRVVVLAAYMNDGEPAVSMWVIALHCVHAWISSIFK